MPVQKHWPTQLSYQVALAQCKFKMKKEKKIKMENCSDKKGKWGMNEKPYRPNYWHWCSST